MVGVARNVLKPFGGAIKGAAVEAGQSVTEWRIEGAPGLILRCSKAGGAVWYFVFTLRGAGGRIKLGERESTTFKQAKDEALRLLALVKEGKDPRIEQAIEERANKLSSATYVTFRQVYADRLKAADLKPTTASFYRYCIEGRGEGEQSVLEMLGDEPLVLIDSRRLLEVINKVEERGSLTAHDKVKSAISAVLGWAAERGMIEHNPARVLGKRTKVTPRTRKAKPEDLKKLWEACGRDAAVKVDPAMKIIIKLAILTAQRRTEVAGARVTELALDGPEPVWVLPGDTIKRGKKAERVFGRTKNGQEHVVPLSRQAAECWRDALALRESVLERAVGVEKGEWEKCVFPSPLLDQGKVPHVRGDRVTEVVAKLTALLKIKDVTAHDLRRTMSTWAGDRGVPPHVVKRILNHMPSDVTQRHYMQSRLDGEARAVLQEWADYVEGLGEAL